MTLLSGSFSVSDTPEVWQCVRSDSESAFFGSNGLISSATGNARRAASLLP